MLEPGKTGEVFGSSIPWLSDPLAIDKAIVVPHSPDRRCVAFTQAQYGSVKPFALSLSKDPCDTPARSG